MYLQVATAIGKYNTWTRTSSGKYIPLGRELRSRIIRSTIRLDEAPSWYLSFLPTQAMGMDMDETGRKK